MQTIHWLKVNTCHHKCQHSHIHYLQRLQFGLQSPISKNIPKSLVTVHHTFSHNDMISDFAADSINSLSVQLVLLQVVEKKIQITRIERNSFPPQSLYDTRPQCILKPEMYKKKSLLEVIHLTMYLLSANSCDPILHLYFRL
jgi:hypothetical protein